MQITLVTPYRCARATAELRLFFLSSLFYVFRSEGRGGSTLCGMFYCERSCKEYTCGLSVPGKQVFEWTSSVAN